MFSRENRRPKRAKSKIYLSFEDCRGFRCGSLFGAVVVSTGPEVVQGFEASGPVIGWLWSSGVVFPPFVRSLALLVVGCLQICLYLRF